MREAGDHTTWTDPDEDYENAVHAAVDAAIDNADVRSVLDELVQQIAAAGWSNSLAMKLVSITMPGVPDVYQGSEVEQFSLVDPDNRRPVDYDSAAASLADGSVDKQTITSTALRLRRDRPELFTGYTPLRAEGPAAEHVLAFDRGGVVTVVTRLPARAGREGRLGGDDDRAAGGELAERAHGTWFRDARWRSLLNHRDRLGLSEVLGDLPVALLVRDA